MCAASAHTFTIMKNLILCDLDGTLLRPGHPVSSSTLETLTALRRQGDIVAIASGRSLYAGREIVTPEMPIDFWLFSTGAGIVSWPSREIIRRNELTTEDTTRIANYLLSANEDFMIQAPVPENHRFTYHKTARSDNASTDFDRRCAAYPGLCRPMREDEPFTAASQFIAVLPPDESRINAIRAALSDYSVIRATSPMDNHSVWLEIFNKHAGKGNSAKWLAREYLPSKGIEITSIYAIGNDYNDLDMLEFADFGFLAPSAPSSLRERFPVTRQDTDGALTEAVAAWKLLKS